MANNNQIFKWANNKQSLSADCSSDIYSERSFVYKYMSFVFVRPITIPKCIYHNDNNHKYRLIEVYTPGWRMKIDIHGGGLAESQLFLRSLRFPRLFYNYSTSSIATVLMRLIFVTWRNTHPQPIPIFYVANSGTNDARYFSFQRDATSSLKTIRFLIFVQFHPLTQWIIEFKLNIVMQKKNDAIK